MKRLPQILPRLFALLPDGASRYLVAFGIVSALLTALDTVAIALLALTLSPLMSAPAGTTPSVTVPVLGRIAGDQVLWLLVAAAGLMIVKAFAIVAMQYHATRTFERYELESGRRLFQAYIHSPWTERLRRSSTDLAQLGDVGIANMIAGILLPAAQIPAELLTMVSVVLIIFLQKPIIATVTVVYLGTIAVVLFLWIARHAEAAGRVNRDSALLMMRLMAEMVSALKEITLRDKSDEVGEEIQRVRRRVARSRANIRFLQAVPKFVVDIALVGGLLLVGAVAYWQSGSLQGALASLALFGIAGFKIIPSITRFQNYATQIDASMAYADAVISDVSAAEGYLRDYQDVGREPMPVDPRTLSLHDVAFTYPGSERPAVRDVDLDVPIGSSLALVGGSGAGKSTLVDLLLGLLTPSTGTLAVDGTPLTEVLHAWRSRVGYVPQDVMLFDGTIAQNVALTWADDYDAEKVRAALRRAQLLDIVEARPGGIDARIGERGLTLSGGQRQRLGIARALYVEPLVLVLDEATSALDTATEEAVSQAIREMHGEVTVVAVAHRLSTIRHSDQVCFMQDGRIAARGTFDEVVATAPEFAEQARLAGLA